MSKHARPGHTTTAIDLEQIARILADENIDKLLTLDHGGMRAFICSGPDEGDFTLFQCGQTGDGFIVENANRIGDSVHHHARAVLSATYGG